MSAVDDGLEWFALFFAPMIQSAVSSLLMAWRRLPRLASLSWLGLMAHTITVTTRLLRMKYEVIRIKQQPGYVALAVVDGP